MTREEAIRIIETVFQDEYVYKYYDSITHQALNMAIEALSADAESDDLISRADAISKCKNAENELTDEAERKGVRVARFIIGEMPSADAVEVDRTSEWVAVRREEYEDLIADAVPTVIRAKTFMRKEDFDKWAEDIKRQNKSIVCIPYDAEVVSADAVDVVRCKDCIHWKADNEVFELGFCCVFPQKWVAETFYCADGERREE